MIIYTMNNGKMKSVIDKLEEIDEILMGFEDILHGEDGRMCTEARNLIAESISDIKTVKKSIDEIQKTIKDGILG